MADDLSTRRQALTGLGAVGVIAVAGCVTAGSGPETMKSVDGNTPNPTAHPDRRVTDITVTGLSESPVSITPTVTEADITTERTAQFHLTVRGRSDDPVGVQFGNQIPFSAPQESTPSGILLLASGPEYARRNQETWLPNTEKGDSIHAPDVMKGADLAPDETVTGVWEVWADPDHASHIAPGTWQFENSLIFPRESSNEMVEWVLSLTIED
jgi:hypothetical protein